MKTASFIFWLSIAILVLSMPCAVVASACHSVTAFNFFVMSWALSFGAVMLSGEKME